MKTEQFFEQCRAAAGIGSQVAFEPDALIGFFQAFRPHGEGLAAAFEGLSDGDDLVERLSELYRVCGDSLRPQGGRDAYFVVRRPEPVEAVVVESLARDWLENLASLARGLGNERIAQRLSGDVGVRVLEGIAPKPPKAAEDRSDLLELFQHDLPDLLAPVTPADSIPALLRPAYYFVACDAALRDYLMWPLYRDPIRSLAKQGSHLAVEADPFEPYFTLWRHGIKYRVFTDDQVDFYIPRPEGR